MAYNGWKISEENREMLLRVFKPRYPDVIAHHITLTLSADLPEAAECHVIGYCDGSGVECLVVAVNGEHVRPDGRTFHVTLSIDRAAGKKPVHSNDAIRDFGWTEIDPIAISTTPFFVNNKGEEFFTIS